MFRAIPRLICILTVLALAVAGSAGTAFAADEIGETVGTGPDTAAAPMAEWISLADGAKHWYVFTEGGDENDVEVRMDLSQDDSAVFEIWTSEQLRSWQNSDDFDPIGAGTVNENLSDDLYWTGNFVASNTYYVVVNSRNFGPVDYQLTVNGKDVGFPTIQTSPESADTEIAIADQDGSEILEESAGLIVEGAAIDESSAGAHAGVALTPMGQVRTIAPGETQWYAFRDEGDEGTIQAILDASPNIGVLFEVWTAEQLRLWQAAEEFDPVGAGTENEGADIDQFWTGSFVRSGDYYVVVRHTGLIDGAAEYSLSVTGEDVSY